MKSSFNKAIRQIRVQRDSLKRRIESIQHLIEAAEASGDGYRVLELCRTKNRAMNAYLRCCREIQAVA